MTVQFDVLTRTYLKNTLAKAPPTKSVGARKTAKEKFFVEFVSFAHFASLREPLSRTEPFLRWLLVA
jgi:hypothetical protein